MHGGGARRRQEGADRDHPAHRHHLLPARDVHHGLAVDDEEPGRAGRAARRRAPRRRSADQQELDKAVTLTVTEKGDVFYNKEKITLAQLPMRLQTLKTTAKDPKVIINGDGGATFKHRRRRCSTRRKKLGHRQGRHQHGQEMKFGWLLGDRRRGRAARGIPARSAGSDRGHREGGEEGRARQVDLLADEDEKPKDDKKPEEKT